MVSTCEIAHKIKSAYIGNPNETQSNPTAFPWLSFNYMIQMLCNAVRNSICSTECAIILLNVQLLSQILAVALKSKTRVYAHCLWYMIIFTMNSIASLHYIDGFEPTMSYRVDTIIVNKNVPFIECCWQTLGTLKVCLL